MFGKIFRATLVCAALISGANSALSGVRSFFSPSLLGDQIAFCTTANEVCGKPVADAWCTGNGFEEAILYQRNRNARKSSGNSVRYIDSGEVCTGGDCVTFAQIKCYSSN